MIKMVESFTRVFTNQLRFFQLKPLQLQIFQLESPLVSILFARIKIFISFCWVGKTIFWFGKNCCSTYGLSKFCDRSWEFTRLGIRGPLSPRTGRFLSVDPCARRRTENFIRRATFKIDKIKNKSSRIFKTNLGMWPTIWWFLSKQSRHLVKIIQRLSPYPIFSIVLELVGNKKPTFSGQMPLRNVFLSNFITI